MRIVLIHRYFWPDTPPYAHILRDIALALGERGHQVTVLTCQPSYGEGVRRAPARERLAATVEVRRVGVLPDRRSSVRKGINLLWFCLRLLAMRRSLGSVDVVMAASTPPLAVARIGSILASRTGARFVYHKQDIYPEVVTAPGILRHRRLAGWLRRADSATDRRAARVVVLSPDMFETIAARGVSRERIAVINNFDPWDLNAQAPAPDIDTDRVVGRPAIVFAGNLGRFQNLETVMAAGTALGPDAPFDLHFFGAGPLAGELKQQAEAAELRWIHFHGHRPPTEVARFLRTEAAVGIVSLAPGVVRAAYPSKTLSYLRAGCPVLALVEPDCDLAQTIIAAGAGFVASPTNPSDLARLLAELAATPERMELARAAAAELYRSEFARDRQLARWIELFERQHHEAA